jgi:hypothetical protein
MMRRIGWIVAGGLLAWWWFGDDGDAPVRAADRPADRRPFEAPQTAVTSTGFASADGPIMTRRVTELATDGAVEWQATSKLPEESRVVGTGRGIAAVWRDGHRLIVAGIEDDGDLSSDRQSFGKKVRRMCDGTASNDGRWGVAFLEGDGKLWVVHGLTDRERTASEATIEVAVAPAAQRTSWCAVASGGDNIVLIWRRGNRVFMTECTRKECSGFAPNIPDALARETILGAGCLKKGCGFATRDGNGKTRVTYVDDKGRQKWSAALGDARPGTAIDVIGAGDRQLAVAYATERGAVVVRLDGKGAAAPVWRAADDDATVPGLAWSRGRLLVARTRDGALVNDVVALPR